MKKRNMLGNYEADTSEELARVGNAFVELRMCECEEDGLFRYALALRYSHGGFCGPIFGGYTGYATAKDARDAALGEMQTRLEGSIGNGDPECAQNEFRGLLGQIGGQYRQLSLF